MTVELSESLINGRFKVSDRPYAAPGKCAVCGSVERAVIDFGLDVDYYGVVYICVDCLKAAVQVMGASDGDKSSETQTVPLNLIDQEAINEYVRNATDAISRLNSVLSSFGFVLVSVEDSKSIDENDAVDGESELTDESDAQQSLDITFSEGPVSVSTSRSDELPSFKF